MSRLLLLVLLLLLLLVLLWVMLLLVLLWVMLYHRLLLGRHRRRMLRRVRLGKCEYRKGHNDQSGQY